MNFRKYYVILTALQNWWIRSEDMTCFEPFILTSTELSTSRGIKNSFLKAAQKILGKDFAFIPNLDKGTLRGTRRGFQGV